MCFARTVFLEVEISAPQPLHLKSGCQPGGPRVSAPGAYRKPPPRHGAGPQFSAPSPGRRQLAPRIYGDDAALVALRARFRVARCAHEHTASRPQGASVRTSTVRPLGLTSLTRARVPKVSCGCIA